MFTGLVTHVGRIVRAENSDHGRRLFIQPPADFFTDAIQIGESIAVQGICLTVVAVEEGALVMQASPETLSCTHGLEQGADVNLERSLRLSDRMGGHWVTGHVDAVARVRAFLPEEAYYRLELDVPASLHRYLARKGSLTVDGVSLTINEVDEGGCAITLIPHTLKETTLRRLMPRAHVNIEVDILARYLERLQQQP